MLFGETKTLTPEPAPMVRGVFVVVALVVAGACTKKAAPSAPPTPTRPSVSQPSQPVAAGASLPAEYDLSKLDEPRRKIYDQVVAREPSACGKGESLLNSVKHDSACRASFYAVRYVARLAESGFSEAEIVDKLRQRFHEPRVPFIDLSTAPGKGNPSARVRVVEFADYQCSHCKQAQPVLHSLAATYPNDVVLYFKHFPLGGHTNSVNAALGAVAAQRQDKFWQFADKIWENSEQISPALLESLAKDIGLDFSKWYADVGTEEVRAQVQRDRAEGRSLEIHKTPAIFINNRRFTDEPDLPSLKDWIEEEIGR
jgi:2-hydroxychromene-2-carboxylate isomerase